MKSTAIAVTLLSVVAAVQPLRAQEQPGGPKPPSRLALVVGNQVYSKLRSLPAVSEEVKLVRAALEAAGFVVTPVADANNDNLSKALDAFVARVQKGDICFFYYAGYAAQDQDGEDDFLIPTDFDPSATSLNTNSAYPLTLLAKNLGDRQAALKMFFLEGATRTDVPIPKARPGLRKPYTVGLPEVFFAIPTAESRFVDTPPDQAGLFTKALVEVINSVGVPLTALMAQVLKKVSDQVKDQLPTSDDTVTQEFYFHPLPPPPHGPPPRSQNRNDREFYVWIRPGTFMMGCVPKDTKCEGDEKPQHEVTISKGFWMGENEVQVDSYRIFVDKHKKDKRTMPPRSREGDNWHTGTFPISNMKWEDARDYCSWAGGRLPTEAEWEYAARGGKANEVYPFDPTDYEEMLRKARYHDKKGNELKNYQWAVPVKKFAPNAFELYDMAGNVWELVSDYWGPYSSAPAADPKGPETGKAHVKRGGSYDSDPLKHLRISFREKAIQWTNVGFRCVMDESAQTKQILQIP